MPPVMIFLDLDLDFFLDSIALMRDDSGERLSGADYKPWDPNDVRLFLERNCGLSIDRRRPGRVVEHNDQAWDFWKDLISEGRLSVPFDVVHVDAHADLGLGDAGYVYLMSELLHVDLDNRSSEADRDQIMPGNFLSFAVACQWIRRLVYVRHPKARDDLISYHFKDFDTRSGFIQLKRLESGVFAGAHVKPVRELPILALEPEVPFEMIQGASFRTTRPFDFVILSRSPGFTPRESDQLIPVVSRYIEPV